MNKYPKAEFRLQQHLHTELQRDELINAKQCFSFIQLITGNKIKEHG